MAQLQQRVLHRATGGRDDGFKATLSHGTSGHGYGGVVAFGSMSGVEAGEELLDHTPVDVFAGRSEVDMLREWRSHMEGMELTCIDDGELTQVAWTEVAKLFIVQISIMCVYFWVTNLAHRFNIFLRIPDVPQIGIFLWVLSTATVNTSIVLLSIVYENYCGPLHGKSLLLDDIMGETTVALTQWVHLFMLHRALIPEAELKYSASRRATWFSRAFNVGFMVANDRIDTMPGIALSIDGQTLLPGEYELTQIYQGVLQKSYIFDLVDLERNRPEILDRFADIFSKDETCVKWMRGGIDTGNQLRPITEQNPCYAVFKRKQRFMGLKANALVRVLLGASLAFWMTLPVMIGIKSAADFQRVACKDIHKDVHVDRVSFCSLSNADANTERCSDVCYDGWAFLSRLENVIYVSPNEALLTSVLILVALWLSSAAVIQSKYRFKELLYLNGMPIDRTQYLKVLNFKHRVASSNTPVNLMSTWSRLSSAWRYPAYDEDLAALSAIQSDQLGHTFSEDGDAKGNAALDKLLMASLHPRLLQSDIANLPRVDEDDVDDLYTEDERFITRAGKMDLIWKSMLDRFCLDKPSTNFTIAVDILVQYQETQELLASFLETHYKDQLETIKKTKGAQDGEAKCHVRNTFRLHSQVIPEAFCLTHVYSKTPDGKLLQIEVTSEDPQSGRLTKWDEFRQHSALRQWKWPDSTWSIQLQSSKSPVASENRRSGSSDCLGSYTLRFQISARYYCKMFSKTAPRDDGEMHSFIGKVLTGAGESKKDIVGTGLYKTSSSSPGTVWPGLKPPKRLTTGSQVRVKATGEFGEIIQDNRTPQPYKIRFQDGEDSKRFFREGELEEAILAKHASDYRPTVGSNVRVRATGRAADILEDRREAAPYRLRFTSGEVSERLYRVDELDWEFQPGRAKAEPQNGQQGTGRSSLQPQPIGAGQGVATSSQQVVTGTVLVATQKVPVFASVESWEIIDNLQLGDKREVFSQPKQVGEYNMVTIKPTGAVELRLMDVIGDASQLLQPPGWRERSTLVLMVGSSPEFVRATYWQIIHAMFKWFIVLPILCVGLALTVPVLRALEGGSLFPEPFMLPLFFNCMFQACMLFYIFAQLGLLKVRLDNVLYAAAELERRTLALGAAARLPIGIRSTWNGFLHLEKAGVVSDELRTEPRLDPQHVRDASLGEGRHIDSGISYNMSGLGEYESTYAPQNSKRPAAGPRLAAIFHAWRNGAWFDTRVPSGETLAKTWGGNLGGALKGKTNHADKDNNPFALVVNTETVYAPGTDFWNEQWQRKSSNVKNWYLCTRYLKVCVNSERLLSQSALIAVVIGMLVLIGFSTMQDYVGVASSKIDVADIMKAHASVSLKEAIDAGNDMMSRATSQAAATTMSMATKVTPRSFNNENESIQRRLSNVAAVPRPRCDIKNATRTLQKALDPFYRQLHGPLQLQFRALVDAHSHAMQVGSGRRLSNVDSNVEIGKVQTHFLTFIFIAASSSYVIPLFLCIALINCYFEKHVYLLISQKVNHHITQTAREQKQFDIVDKMFEQHKANRDTRDCWDDPGKIRYEKFMDTAIQSLGTHVQQFPLKFFGFPIGKTLLASYIVIITGLAINQIAGTAPYAIRKACECSFNPSLLDHMFCESELTKLQPQTAETDQINGKVQGIAQNLETSGPQGNSTSVSAALRNANNKSKDLEPSWQEDNSVDATTVSDQFNNETFSDNMKDISQNLEIGSQPEASKSNVYDHHSPYLSDGDNASRRLSQTDTTVLPVVTSIVEHWWDRGAPRCDSAVKFDIVELTLEQLQLQARLLARATRAIQHINNEHGFLAALDLALSYQGPHGKLVVDDK